jgi:hypothetical protein
MMDDGWGHGTDETERKGKERKGKERKGKERKGKERKGKERKGKERKSKREHSAGSALRARAGCWMLGVECWVLGVVEDEQSDGLIHSHGSPVWERKETRSRKHWRTFSCGTNGVLDRDGGNPLLSSSSSPGFQFCLLVVGLV